MEAAGSISHTSGKGAAPGQLYRPQREEGFRQLGGKEQILLNLQADRLARDVIMANRVICCTASIAGSTLIHEIPFCHVSPIAISH